MKTAKSLFGTFQEEEVWLFDLENDNGMKVKLMSYGATITSITVPSEDGPVELVCGFDSFEGYFSEEYKNNAPYFGCTVGRYCGMIKDGKFKLDGQEYQLATNAGANNLHGGNIGFDKKIWQTKIIDDNKYIGIEFILPSADMEEGFPGNVSAKVKIQLNNSNEITIDYSASTDQATPLTMTNHTYFNLSGFEQSVEGHQAQVFTDKLMEMDDTGAATGKILDVAGTANDMREGKTIGDAHASIGGGFEHFYIFDNPGMELRKTAELSDPESKRSLEVYSREPCMLLYSGKYTSDELKRENGLQYGQFRGFCCETQRWQNGPNIPGSPGTITTPEKPFKSTTVFKLKY